LDDLRDALDDLSDVLDDLKGVLDDLRLLFYHLSSASVEKSRNSRNTATNCINIDDFLLRFVDFVAACGGSGKRNGARFCPRPGEPLQACASSARLVICYQHR